ncbi:MAG TPA: M14 family metallopeptidase, partial [Vicinamibacterales bacterium]
STEVAAPQHTPLLLYDILRRANEREMAAILDNVILMLWPTINPDGHSMVADWYMARAGTPNESVGLPHLYQEYVGHDNNRDAYMLNMVESRVMEHAWREWEPHIIYVHHQSAPFPTRIWLPPFAEPIATHAPYLLSREVNMIGMAIAKGLEERGQVGATHMGTGYDAWYPGYIDYLPMFKNIAAFWTETQGTGAAPRTSTPEQIPAAMRRPQALYSSPWMGGTWRLRDAVEYMHTASLSVLEYASRYKESLLFNRYQAGRDQILRGRREAPYAYLVPQDQRDPVAAVELLRRLAFSGVRVSQLTAAAAIENTSYPAGTWIVPADQEFAALAREVLDVQKYPEIRESPNGLLDQPYDAAGWTLPLAMGVKVVPVMTRSDAGTPAPAKLLGPPVELKVKPVPYVSGRDDAAPFDSVPGLGFDSNPNAAAIVPPAGRLAGSGPALAVNPAENNAFRAINRAWRAGGTVQFRPGAGNASASRYVISGVPAGEQDQLVRALALTAERTPAAGSRCGAPASRSSGRPIRAWTRDGRGGCSNSTASSSRESWRPTSRPVRSGASTTCCFSPTTAAFSRVLVAADEADRRRPSPRRRRPRPTKRASGRSTSS